MSPTERTRQKKIFTVAYDDHHAGMLSRASFKVSDRELSEDVVQDTFLKVWRYLLKGGKVKIMKSFLHHILNGLIVDEYRKRTHKATSLDVLIEKGYEPVSEHSDGSVNVLDGRAALLLVSQLPEKYQKVLRMRYLQSLSISEIALLTGQSKNVVAVQLHRAIKKLATLYSEGVGVKG